MPATAPRRARTLTLRSAALIALMTGVWAAFAARADLNIVITSGVTDPIPIAIPPLAGSDGTSAQLGQDIVGVITNDLANCGLFRPIAPAAFIQASNAPPGDAPNLAARLRSSSFG